MALDELRAARVGPGWRLVLPGRTPTKGNHRVKARGRDVLLPSKGYMRWMKETAWSAVTLWARLRNAGVTLPAATPIRISIAVYLPTPGRGDEDNYKKAVGDWLQTNNFVVNDRLIHWHETRIGLDRQEPRLELVVQPYVMQPGEI